jgi:hypothetical protein
LTKSFVLSIGDKNGVAPGFRLGVGLVATPVSARVCSDTPQQPVKRDSLGFQAEAAVVGYLVFAVGVGGAFDLLEYAGR